MTEFLDYINDIYSPFRVLKSQGYFGPDRTDLDPETDDLSEDEAFIGRLLFHFLSVLQFNSHEVAQVEYPYF